MKKRFRISTLFALIATFIVSLIVSISLCITPAKAASNAGELFEMEYGASVKLNSNGLRFKAKMDEGYRDYIVENDNIELWAYIAPVQEFDKVTEYKDLGIKVGGALDEGKIYQGQDGYYYANIVITDLDDYTSGGVSLYAQSFSAIAFIKDTSNHTYVYADMAKDDAEHINIDAQNRTQYEIVNAAFLDGDESYESKLIDTYGDWYGTEKYPIVIESETESAAFVEKLADAAFKAKIEGKHVFVKEGVTADIESVSVNKTTGHTVTFYDGNKVVDVQFVADGGDATPPAMEKPGYKFVEWVGATTGISQDENVYAKWTFTKGDVIDTGDMKVYGVTLANGSTISQDSDVIGQKVILASGYLGDGAYYPGETNEVPDPTDENNTADQAYLAYDGSYGFNDYFVADFTGKNMPTLAFFANNYDNSIFYGDGTKNGVVVATGFTWPDGRLFTQDGVSYSTSVFNGAGLCMWGPHMIYNTGNNNNPKGVLLHSNEENVALGRANLVSGTQYRVIMGFQPGDDPVNKAIKLVYNLYNLDTNELVESKAINTYNFFADGWANAGQTRDQFCLGSIVAYGYFGTTTVLDKTYDIFEDTTIGTIAEELGMPSASNVTFEGDSIVLGAGSIGAGANYTKGQNAGGSITQSYYAINGDYSFDDYIALDFTGKNMPEIMFFADNYDTSMYYTEGKQGVVVASGITLWDGTTGSAQSNNTKVGVSGPFGAYFEGAAAPHGGNMMSDFESPLARANLVDGKQYRVIMGFKNNGNTFTLNYYLYNLTDKALVKEESKESWAFFTGSNADVNNMTLNGLSGSIVLYGKFGTTCTIDKLHGVFEDTNIADVAQKVSGQEYSVVFQDSDGTLLQTSGLVYGQMPEYTGELPVKASDGVTAYEFAGWDKEVTAVTGDVTYTATYTTTLKDNVTLSGSAGHTYGVEIGNKIVLKKSNLGDSANYTLGQQNAEGAWVHQSYLALDGNYALNDYVAFDFTGKNLPEIAFFANNYNDSMYAEGTSKQGIVVVTGITTWQGAVSEVNNNGTQINYGFPYMIQNTADGGFVRGAFANSALGRANLVDGTHYRVIMGFTGSGNAITLNWYLYNLDTQAVVEQSSMTTWNFFTGSNAQVGNMTINDLSGSIVLYGKFGVACTLDKVWGVFEDTDIASIAAGLNGDTKCTVTFKNEKDVLQEEQLSYGVTPEYKGEIPTKEDKWYDYTFIGWDKAIAPVAGDVTYTAQFEATLKPGYNKENVTFADEEIVLGAGNIGAGANYTKGQNAGGSITQSYFAFDGDYGFNDYIVFDFTGKNMPEIMFFAKNYDTSMYYTEGKQGVVVASGITLWDGTTGSAQSNNTKVGVSGPFGAYFEGAAAPHGGNMLSDFEAKLARANLVDDTQYRVIMGFKNNGNTFTLEYVLYDVTNDETVETVAQTSWGFFTGSDEKVGNMTLNNLSGSIVLYGKFGSTCTCTIDKVWGIYEDSTLVDVATAVLGGNDEGGDSGEGSAPSSNAPDYSKYTDQFDFYAYSCYSDGTYEIDGVKYYVGKNLGNLKQYALYGDVGMTIYFPQNDFIISDDASTVVRAKKLIDDLAKAGITKTILQDNRILHLSMTETAIVGSGCQFADETALDAYIYNCLKDYATYPGVYGVMLGDEPKHSMLSAYAAVYNSIKRVNAANGWNLFVQYNLNPLNVTEEVYTNYYPATSGTYAWNDYRYTLKIRDRFTDTVTRYKQYINDFLNAMNPDSIMYDDYPLMENKSGNLEIKDSYIPCLQIVAKAAADRGIKFYHVTQAYENNADGSIHRRAVTEKGAKWLNNILLGFGAKQLAYYTYYTRAESDASGPESYVDGQSFVDYNGNPTALYGWMKEILANNQKFAPTILQFDYKGSRLYGSTSANHLGEITVSNSFTKLSGFSVSTGSALVTELYDDENDNYMYMAMNVLDPDATSTEETVTMTFNGYTHALVYKDGVATEVALSGGVYKTALTNGEAVYVIPFN